MRLLASASKLVFLALTLTACIGFFMGRLEAKDFMVLAIGAYGYYFGYKPTDTTGQPMAGK